MTAPERRPHIARACPVPGCGEPFVTSWWVMTPSGVPVTQEVSMVELTATVERHIVLAHATTPVQYFT